VHVELEALFLVLRQQRIVVAEALDEAAVARCAAVGGDDVIERPLLGSGAGHADDDWHWKSFLSIDRRWLGSLNPETHFFLKKSAGKPPGVGNLPLPPPPSPGNLPRPGSPELPGIVGGIPGIPG